MKKTIIAILGIIALVTAANLFPQAVTNTNVDIIISQPVDDALHIAWRVDENLRTNGIAPYTSVQLAITYRQYLAQAFSNGIPDASIVNNQNEAALLAQVRFLRDTDPQRHARIYRVAFNKGNQ